MGCGSSNHVADVVEPEAEKAQDIPSNVKQDITIQDLEGDNTTSTSTGHLQDDKSQLIPERNLHTVEDNKNRSQDKKTRNLIDKTQIKNEINKSRSSQKAFESSLSNNKKDDVNTNINSVKSNDEKVVKEKAEKNIIRPKEDIPLRSAKVKHGKDGKQSESVPDGDTNVGSSPGGTIKHKQWTIEDTFWVGKRKLMTDIERIRLVDQHAVKAPSNLRKDAERLVPHLLTVAQSDLEKFRVIYRWLAQNIVYDVELLNNGKISHGNTAQEVLQTGVAVCEGYARLYQHLCQIAGLECVVDRGISKGLRYIPCQGKKLSHAWNRIKIDGNWYGCDCTWSAGGGRINTSTGRYKIHKEWKESWFMAEPRAHDSSHLPESGYEHVIDIEAQISHKSYKTYQEWDNEPHTHPGFFKYGLKLLESGSSSPGGEIHTKNNSVEIRIECPYAMRIYPKLQKSDGPDGQFDEYVMWYFVDVTMVMKVRLPTAGAYVLKICGYPHDHDDDDDDDQTGVWNGCLVVYKLVGSSKHKTLPFPKLKGYSWGVSWYGYFNGIQSISSKDAIVAADNGQACIELSRKDLRGQMFLEYFHQDNPSEGLAQYVYAETDKDLFTLHLLCPKIGSYSCCVYFKSEEKGKNLTGAQFLVICKKLAEKQLRYPSDSPVFWGANNLIGDLGITTIGSSSSSVITDHGEGELSFHVPVGVKLTHGLIDVKGKEISKTWICAESTLNTDGSRTVRLRIRCPKKGHFRLNMYANEESKANFAYAGRWMIICKESYANKLSLFPDHWGNWGPAGDFQKLRLRVKEPKSSTLHPDNKGTCTLVISSDSQLHTAYKLKRADGGDALSRDLTEMSTKVDDLDSSHLVQFNVNVSKLSPGFYSLEVFASNSPGRMGYIGEWLIEI